MSKRQWTEIVLGSIILKNRTAARKRKEDEILTEKTGAIHEAYLLCQKTFEPSIELLDESTNITDAEELRFFRTMSNFFMQQKQKEIIKEA